MKSPFRLLAVVPMAVSLLLAPALKADLLTGNEAQLEAWLGQGDLDFTNIFTKTAGSTSYDFHAAANGQGATFTLMSVHRQSGYGDTSEQIIGGYNPQSWNSSTSFNYTSADAERTAFIFNLTDGNRQLQSLDVGYNGGYYQTYNYAPYGPTFGGGHDIYSDTNLSYGYSENFSYGGTVHVDSIVGGTSTYGYYDQFDIDALEVYTFVAGSGNVPDTASTLGLLGGSLLALAAIRRRVTR